MFLIDLTKEKETPASLLRLLLIRAGIEQNPGPYFCTICTRRLASTSVQCSNCQNWLHIKCSTLKTSKDRAKHKYWTGPCCKPTPSPSSTSSTPINSSPPKPPPSTPPPQNTPPPPSTPPPNDPTADTYYLKILQHNINGIHSKTEELLEYMEKNKIKIAAIQETKLTSKSKPKKTPGYTLLRKDRGTNKGGGLAFIIHQDIHFQVEPTPASLENDEFIESLTISIPSNNNRLMIRNVYIPPQSSCNPQYRPNILALTENLNDTSTIVGDLNAHHTLWFSDDTPDQRGTLIVDTIDGTNFGILNEDQPTRVANNCSTAPDLTITSNSLLQTATWNIESALSSDHLPITITLSTEIKTYKSAKRTFINFNKADWEGFTAFTETSFSNAENLTDYLGEYDVHQNEKFFRNILNEATRKYIPAGRIPEVKNAVPTDAARLINIRESLRKINPNNP